MVHFGQKDQSESCPWRPCWSTWLRYLTREECKAEQQRLDWGSNERCVESRLSTNVRNAPGIELSELPTSRPCCPSPRPRRPLVTIMAEVDKKIDGRGIMMQQSTGSRDIWLNNPLCQQGREQCITTVSAELMPTKQKVAPIFRICPVQLVQASGLSRAFVQRAPW